MKYQKAGMGQTPDSTTVVTSHWHALNVFTQVFRVKLAYLDHPHSPTRIIFFSEGKKGFNSTRTEKGEELTVYGIFFPWNFFSPVFFFWLFVSIIGIELKKGLKQPSRYTRASLEREKVMARKEKKKVGLSFLKQDGNNI